MYLYIMYTYVNLFVLHVYKLCYHLILITCICCIVILQVTFSGHRLCLHWCEIWLMTRYSYSFMTAVSTSSWKVFCMMMEKCSLAVPPLFPSPLPCGGWSSEYLWEEDCILPDLLTRLNSTKMRVTCEQRGGKV